MPDFAATRNFVHDMRNFSLDMVLTPLNVSMKPRGGLRTPYTWKKIQCLKLIFRAFGTKKNLMWKMTLTDPYYGIFHNFFVIFFNTSLPFYIKNLIRYLKTKIVFQDTSQCFSKEVFINISPFKIHSNLGNQYFYLT